MITIFDYYFSKDRFIILEKSDKKTVLSKLVALLDDGDCEEYQVSMLDLIANRESMSTVIFDQEIAVPHPLKAIDKVGKIGVAVVPEGVDWEEGFESIKIIFLVSPSIYKNDGLASMTKLMVNLTENPQAKEAIIKSKTFDDLKTILLDRR